ncbi:MAG: histidine phosphatase family protein, partial [Candidatus Latescibacteria bacterium]|nr:histidine phosphatase family protein [Candidatus Latescibacterota bacterium]
AYSRIWEEDRVNPDSDRDRVESANRVMRRVTSLVVDLEREFSGEAFLLVSHGDAIQILQTAFSGLDAALHREIDHLETA